MSLIIIHEGKLLSQRGLAALSASFVMMYYILLNSKTKKQWEKKGDFFGPRLWFYDGRSLSPRRNKSWWITY